MTLWRGNCYAHVEFTHASIMRIRREFPGAPLVAHPECTKAVRMLADEVCSTEKMVTYCKTHSGEGNHHRDRGRHDAPAAEGMSGQGVHSRADATTAACNECKFMKMNTLEKLHDCMANLQPRIEFARRLSNAPGCRSSECWRFPHGLDFAIDSAAHFRFALPPPAAC